MIRYIPASAAEPLSAALWNLASPSAQRKEGATSFMFGWVDDAKGGRWLEVHDDFSILVHPEAVLDGLASIFRPFIDAGQMPPNANKFLAAFITFKRGKRLVIYDAFPQFFKDQAKTYEQMVDAGLLPTQNSL
jgi:hypothetical protein